MTGLFKKAVQGREAERLARMELANERDDLRRKWKELAQREKELLSSDEYGRIHSIPTESILPNPAQPRRQFDDESIIRLADSIRQYGILQPLTIRRGVESSDSADGPYELVAGERRLRAAKLLGLTSVPCLLIRADSQRSAELAIIENIQREDLNIFEQAGSIASLIELHHLTQEEAARQLSMSQSFVANKLRILRLTAPEREKILALSLTERHARALLKVDSVEQRLKIIDYIGAHRLNVATTEAYIERFLAESSRPAHARPPRRIVLKDIRIFYNSIDKALALIRQAGIGAESEKSEDDDSIRLVIRIPKEQGTSSAVSPSDDPFPDCESLSCPISGESSADVGDPSAVCV